MISLAAALLVALVPVPQLTGPVVDRAGVLSRQDVARLDQMARASRQSGGPQLGFLLVPTTEDEPIESYSIRVAEAWQLGSAEKDDGLLFVVAVQDRAVRIEVGGGLEGEITDLQASRIIQEEIVPAFREERYGLGLAGGAARALELTGITLEGAPPPRERPTRQRLPLPVLIFFLIFLFMNVIGGGRRRRGFFIGGPFGGFGGGGFGGRGGGSWGGGGGGFSGGGASGNW